jgi:hypothetical protein
MMVSFFAVFILQLSAPFPYDDYQVPLALNAIIPASVLFARLFPSSQFGWFAVAISLIFSGTSPLLQEWTTYTPDRFWSRKIETSELGKLRKVAREINALDPGGTAILTQDAYLAVETSRKVPSGFEMGPFSFFPGVSDEKAKEMRVHNVNTLLELIRESNISIAAMSGYGFAIAAPECARVKSEDLEKIGLALDQAYKPVGNVYDFGQNETTLTIYKRRRGQNED